MTTGDLRHQGAGETDDFARTINLSDAIFAIAMTLLALTLTPPDVSSGELATALFETLPRLGVYVLAFALVAAQWQGHRKLFRRLARADRSLTFLNLAFLGGVALVPFPTAVLGSHPTATSAVAAFLALFVLLNALYVALIVRAQAARAWHEPLPRTAFERVVVAFAVSTGVLLVAVVTSIWAPLLALGVAALSGLPSALVLRRVPDGYRGWF